MQQRYDPADPAANADTDYNNYRPESYPPATYHPNAATLASAAGVGVAGAAAAGHGPYDQQQYPYGQQQPGEYYDADQSHYDGTPRLDGAAPAPYPNQDPLARPGDSLERIEEGEEPSSRSASAAAARNSGPQLPSAYVLPEISVLNENQQAGPPPVDEATKPIWQQDYRGSRNMMFM